MQAAFTGRVTSSKAALCAALVLLALLPVLLAPVPGFVDMPSHMARHHVMANIGHDAALAHWFGMDWHWIANLGVDLPSVLLTPLLGSETATLLVAALLAPLMVGGIFALSRAAHGRVSASAFIALPLALHQAWMWGFLNYCMSVGLALLVAAWLYARQRGGWRDGAAMAVLALVVATGHVAGWVILLILAAGNELGRLRNWRAVLPAVVPAILRNWPLLAPIVPLLVWRAAAKGPSSGFHYDPDVIQSKLVVFLSALKGTERVLDLALLATMLLAALLALVWAGGRRVDWRLVISGAILAVAALLAPTTIFNSWGTDLRTAPIALLLLIMAIAPAERPERERALCLVGIALFLVRVGSVTVEWRRHGIDLAQRLAMLDAVPRGGKLGYLWIKPACGFPWRLVPDEKLGSYALVRRDAFVNTLFMVDNAKLMTIRDPHLAVQWNGGSQDVEPVCPGHLLDRAMLASRMRAMSADRFDAIWISGVDRKQIPALPGYRAARSSGGDVLLLRSPG